MASEFIPNGYFEWLEALKGRIQAARSRAALAVNSELIRLCQQISQQPADPLPRFATAATCKEYLQVQSKRNGQARSWPKLAVFTANLKESCDGL